MTDTCHHEYESSNYCGASVCVGCDDHRGLARCFCGWSRTAPGHGREELEMAGEIIEPEG